MLTNNKLKKYFVAGCISAFCLIFYFSQSYIAFLIFLLFTIYLYKTVDDEVILDAYLFNLIFTLLLPPKYPFSGNQFAYYDHIFSEELSFQSISYSTSFDYFGFHLLANTLLINGNLYNLSVGLFFVNLLGFYSLLRFYKQVFKNKNVFTFKTLLLILFFLINLPPEFNLIMGLPKLLMNGTAGFGSFGLRMLVPASFFLSMFLPLSFLMKGNIKKFIISSLFITLFHYYMLVVFIVGYISFISAKNDKSYLIQLLLSGIAFLYFLNNFVFFKNLSQIFALTKSFNINFNLIPVISLGTIFENKFANNSIYYFNYENFSFFKPEYIFYDFSPTLGVFNNQASIPIEKLLLVSFAIYFSKKLNIQFLKHFLTYSIFVFFISHTLFSLNLFMFTGVMIPWRIMHIVSILCVMVFCSKLQIKVYKKLEIQNNVLTLLLIVPLSYFLWFIYNPIEKPFNEDIKNEIASLSSEIVLMPLKETKNVYYYNFPNTFVSLFPPNDWFFEHYLLDEYLENLRHYRALYGFSNCSEIEEYLNRNNLNIEYIIYNDREILMTEECYLIYIDY